MKGLAFDRCCPGNNGINPLSGIIFRAKADAYEAAFLRKALGERSASTAQTFHSALPFSPNGKAQRKGLRYNRRSPLTQTYDLIFGLVAPLHKRN
ncbi:hypothetical protein SAMN04487969_10130 [Paenibacillus algorifonticola]|uniref:Uncharacterized protein n=1 Tax=Paenibacillus algorifonticola TaxID=684063 RepID=A0A1I1XW17_9BACL|nr:hypothetical protein [Paenibacillus algorifonticola]SFE09740.1 hypothetical protein SAMN04487969_10130 [Paenibacillus algorifonticola]